MKIGDRVRLREGVKFRDITPKINRAVGTVCDVKTGPIGTVISVNYPEFATLAADVAADLFELAETE